MSFLSIRLFATLFTLSMGLSVALACRIDGALILAAKLPPDAAATLAARIQAVRVAGLGFAVVLALGVVVAARRGARGALAARWVLGVGTSIAFLRGAGLVDPLAEHDGLLVLTSVAQLAVEALAIVILYGDDARAWFDRSA